jgi:hypothetical protein
LVHSFCHHAFLLFFVSTIYVRLELRASSRW